MRWFNLPRKQARCWWPKSTNSLGGLGSSVAQALAAHHPTPMAFVAVEDQFGESGTPSELMTKYGLDAASIVRKAKALLGK